MVIIKYKISYFGLLFMIGYFIYVKLKIKVQLKITYKDLSFTLSRILMKNPIFIVKIKRSYRIKNISII